MKQSEKLIMIVDDEPEIRTVIKAILQKYGFQTIDSINGESALKQYTDRPADLVILDMGIPGMSGIKCLEKILSLDKNAKIIFSSGTVDVDLSRQVLAKGAKAFLPKPYTGIELYRMVKNVLDRD